MAEGPQHPELGRTTPPEHDGISLVPVLEGRTTDPTRHEFLYLELYEGGGKQAVVTERWKAVRLNWNERPDAPLELYDLENDLAAQHPDIIEAMEARLATSHTEHPGKTPPPSWGAGKGKSQKI